MDDFDIENNVDIASTPCCNQKLHETCINALISYNNKNKQNTPCPFCRCIVSVYTESNIENDELREDTNNEFSFRARINKFCCYTIFVKRNLITCCSFFIFQAVVVIALFWVPPEEISS
jgi:hypothetical protein